MGIHIEWQNPKKLQDGSKDDLIYTCDLDEVADDAGVYIFARKFGGAFAPIYIGESLKGPLMNKSIESASFDAIWGST